LNSLSNKLEDAIKNPLSYVLYFKNPTHLSRDPKAPPHYHIIIPINSDECLLLTMLTSKVEKIKERYYDNDDCLSCLVEIKRAEIEFVYKNSVIDCNECLYLPKESLLNNPTLKVIPCEPFIDDKILDIIKKAIKKSKIVKLRIKKKIL